MKNQFITKITVLVLTLVFGFQTAKSQSNKVPEKVKTLITHLAKEANQPEAHSADDFYLVVMIGKTQYIAELATGKIVNQKKADYASGGFYGDYAEVNLYFMDKNQQLGGSQGAANLLKLTGNKWKVIARNETDYQCKEVKTVPKTVLKALKIECN